MNPKVAKVVSKAALSAVVTFLIGASIKAQREAEDRIDAHFDAKKDSE